MLVNNQWHAASGPALPVVNPADEETLAEVPSATSDEVGAAVGAAWDATHDWSHTPAIERAGYLRRIGALMRERRDELARSLVAEVGKPLAQAQGELGYSISQFEYVAEWARRIEGEILPSDGRDESIHLVRVPLGVVAMITAWNAPLAIHARKVAPALLTGNTIVLKPSEIAPLTTLALTNMINEEIGLPPGVLNVVTGARETGEALVSDPRVALVSFTGHRDTGKRIMERASANLTRVALEHGGKAPFVVWRDADVPAAVSSCITARHFISGQVCTSAERVYVHGDVADAFIEQYVAAARALRLGDPMSDVDIGPLASRPQFDKAEAALAQALDEGARAVLAGGRPGGDEYARGYWYAPSVLVDVDGGMEVMREETFAPITPIQTISSLEEALSEANASRYGLSAFLFTNDYRVAMTAANDLECGELYINQAATEAVHAHHIGHKQSGIGGEDGKYGVLKYTQLRSVYHRFG